jgi:cytochrome P450
MYPEVQKRAQKEIDEVVGFGRLPDFNDRPQLVYLEALIMELLRWHQPAPFGLSNFPWPDSTRLIHHVGIAHSASEDDVYEGYFIPKGTVVIGNIWYGFFRARTSIDWSVISYIKAHPSRPRDVPRPRQI